MVRPTININHAEFATMYKNRVPTADIAKHFHISLSTVRNTWIRLKIPQRRKCKVRFDENEYIRLFLAGEKYSEMARRLRVSEHVIMESRKRYALPARKRGQKRWVRNDS